MIAKIVYFFCEINVSIVHDKNGLRTKNMHALHVLHNRTLGHAIPLYL